MQLLHALAIIIIMFIQITLCSVPTIRVGYEFAEYTTFEGDEVLTLCVVVTDFPDGSPRPFTIKATTEDGVAGNHESFIM